MIWIILIPGLSILYAFIKMAIKYLTKEEKLSFRAWCLHAFLFLFYAILSMKGLETYFKEWNIP